MAVIVQGKFDTFKKIKFKFGLAKKLKSIHLKTTFRRDPRDLVGYADLDESLEMI